MMNVLPISKIVSEDKLKKAFESIDFNTPKSINSLEEKRSLYEKVVRFTDVDRKSHIYSDDYNRLAQSIRFGKSESFVKFYVPINLYTVEDMYDDRKSHLDQNRQNGRGGRAVSRVNQIRPIRSNGSSTFKYQGPNENGVSDFNKRLITNEQRGNKQRTNLEVYVNGTKLPDCEVLLTVVNGTVDVYFEGRHLQETGNEVVFILKKNSPNRPYKAYYASTNDKVKDTRLPKNKSFNMYVNGLFLMPIKDYKLVENEDKTVSIQLIKPLTEEQILEVIEVNYPCYYPSTYEVNHTGLIYTEDILNAEGKSLDHYKKAISKEIIELYVDGYRYFSDKIEDITATYFIIKDNFIKGKNVYFRVIFEDYDFEDKNIDYLDTYKKTTNFFAKRLVVDKLLKHNMDIEMPEYFDLNNMNENYMPEYLGNYIKDPLKLEGDRQEYLYNILKNYVMRNSYYLKHIAEQFKIEPEKYSIEYFADTVNKYIRENTKLELPLKYEETFKKPMVLFTFNCNLGKSKYYLEKVYANGRYLQKHEYFVKSNDRNMIFIYIDAEIVQNYIEEDKSCYVDCYIERSENNSPVIESFVYKGIQNDLVRFLDFKKFNMNEENYKDLVVSVKYKEWEYFKRLEKEDYELQLILFNGELKIRVKILKTDLPMDCTISMHNPYFIKRDHYKIPEGDLVQLEDTYIINLKNIFNNISENPIFGKYDSFPNLELYYNGLRIFEGLDYKILLPTFENRFDSPRLLLRFEVKQGSTITVINKETSENIVASSYKITSRYGLMYLPTLKYPYSPDYMTVYVNGEIVPPKNIEFIANNFIRLHDVKSLYGFHIMSSVNMPIEVENDLYNISLLTKESFEEYLKKFLENNDYFAPSLDDVYEDAKDIINKTEEEKEEILKPLDPTLPDRFDRIDIGINSVISALLKGNIQKRLDANKEIDMKDVDENIFFDYFPDNIVRLDANDRVIVIKDKNEDENEKLTQSIGLDANENVYDHNEIAEIFVHEQIKDVQESIDGDLDVFEESNMNKYIYPENDIILDANEEFEHVETTILDANDADMEEEGMQPHESDVIVFDSNF